MGSLALVLGVAGLFSLGYLAYWRAAIIWHLLPYLLLALSLTASARHFGRFDPALALFLLTLFAIVHGLGRFIEK